MTSVAGNSLSKSQIAVSVIVPVYGVERYLADCLQSLVAQDFSYAIEILLVNDCSPDGCDFICKEFARNYESVRYIPHEINLGVSAARNTGIEAANGEYLMFVDPDDLVPKTAISDLYNCAVEYKADVVKGNNWIFNDEGKKAARYNVRDTKMFEGDSVFDELLKHENVRGHPWGKLFRRLDFIDIRFPEDVKMAQDLVYCGRVFSKASSLVLLSKNVYHYRLRKDGSTGNKYRSDAYKHWLDSVESLADYVETPQQRRLLFAYYIRTLNQAVKELKKVPASLSSEVMPIIKQRQNKWDVKFSTLVKGRMIAIKCYWRYLMYCLVVRQLIFVISG